MENWQRVFSNLLGVIHLTAGIAILSASPERFTSPNYKPLTDLTDGNVWPFGILFAVAGFLMLTNLKYTVIAGLTVGLVVMNLWAAMFLVAAFESPDAGPLANIMCGGYGLLDCVLAALLLRGGGSAKSKKGG